MSKTTAVGEPGGNSEAHKRALCVPAESAGMRIDAFVAQACEGMTRALVQHLLAQGAVLRNGSIAVKSAKLGEGDCVTVTLPVPQAVEIVAQNIPIEIVYEDDSLVVVNKPKGMVVHPAPGNADGTLVNALLYHCAGRLSGINGEIRPGIVHRIDKDTSGLLVVAKDNETHAGLARQFAAHSITRVYHAVVYGGFAQDTGFVEARLGRHPVDRKKMAIITDASKGRYAYTSYRVLARYEGFSHLALTLRTGRTHQIRVHMASIGHPVAGDAVYGPGKVLRQLNGQCLHAKTLGFLHPKTGEYLEFTCALPEYFTTFLRTMQGGE